MKYYRGMQSVQGETQNQKGVEWMKNRQSELEDERVLTEEKGTK